jgi:hypothetical protein
MLKLFRPNRRAEKLLAEIDALEQDNGVGRDPEAARRALELRHRAGLELVDARGRAGDDYPEPAFDRLPDTDGVPEVDAADLTAELVRAAFLRKGSLIVRGFADSVAATKLAEEIERATEARDSGGDDPGLYEAFEPAERFAKDLALGRAVIKSSGGGGLWGADAPLLFAHVLDTFERAGLRELATDYLGGRPVISVDKCVMRRVGPDIFGEAGGSEARKPSAWHQDGAFMGDVRALNVWLSLSRCGDVAPGMDIVPRRLEGIVPTGTEGAAFDWSVSQAVAEESAGEDGIVRPIFEPGDALLFDELCLHSTAAEPDMPNVRYAIETWFFAPSGYPSDYAPLAF